MLGSCTERTHEPPYTTVADILRYFVGYPAGNTLTSGGLPRYVGQRP